MVNKLIEILGREASLFESFLNLLEQQKAALVANDLESIKATTSEQQTLLAESGRLAREREKIAEQIRIDTDMSEDLTISRLLKTVDEQKAGQLTMLRDTILGLNERINQTRNSNAMLLNQSRKIISRTMNALAKLSQPKATYSKNPALNPNQAAVAVDRRA